jgi:FMN-dependent NADH-azoreductase
MNRTIEVIMRHMGSSQPGLSWSKPASLSTNGSNGSDSRLPGDAVRTKNVLFLQSSPLGSDSYSQRIADSVLNELKAQYREMKFVLRDLEDPPPHIDRAFITAASTQLDELTTEQKKTLTLSEALIDELVDAEIVVIAVPVYNFGIPSTLKAWIDHVVRRGRTFSDTTTRPRGLLHDKRAILILAGGDLYSEPSGSAVDFREPYLRAVLGFIGITDVKIVRVARPGAAGAAAKRIVLNQEEGAKAR